jgi:hypothetical protein
MASIFRELLESAVLTYPITGNVLDTVDIEKVSDFRELTERAVLNDPLRQTFFRSLHTGVVSVFREQILHETLDGFFDCTF